MTSLTRYLMIYDPATGEPVEHITGQERLSIGPVLNAGLSVTLVCSDLTERADLLQDWHWARVERLNTAGDAFIHDPHDMVVLTELTEDKLDELDITTYAYQSWHAFYLARARVYALDNSNDPPDPTLGPQRPVRKFRDKTPGYIVARLIDEAQAGGWCPLMTYTFGGVNDSDDQPWPVTLTVEVPTDSDPLTVLEMLTEQGYCDWTTHGYALDLYLANTVLNEDLTLGDDPTILAYGMGVDSAPLQKSWLDVATDALGIAEDGLEVTDHNDDLVLPGGPLWRRARISGTADSTTATYALAAELRLGAGPREARTRRVNFEWVDPVDPAVTAIQPGRDFDVGSRILIEKGTTADGTIHASTERVMEWRIDQTQQGQTGYVKINDHQARAEERMLRNLQRLTAGTAQGFLGPVIVPGLDTRRPDPPGTPGVVGSPYLNAEGKTRVLWTVTVTANETTDDTQTGITEPIKVDRVHLWAKRSGAGEMLRVRSADWSGSPVVVDYADGDPDIEYSFKAQAESHDGFTSDLSLVAVATVAADEDRVAGPNQVQDATFRSELRKQARVGATTGLTFVADGSETVAALSSTSATLKTGALRSASDKSGRFRVQAGDTVFAKARMRRVGFSGATGSVQVFFEYDDATTGTATAGTAALGTTYAEVGGTTTATKDGWAEVRAEPSSVTGTGTVRVASPYGARQSKANDYELQSVGTGVIVDSSITELKLANAAVTVDKLAANSVSADKVQTSAITTPKLADGSATTLKIASGVAILGVITTGSGLSLGGTSGGMDVDFPSGGTLGDSGSSGLVANVGAGLFHVAGSGTYSGTWAQSSTRDSKVSIQRLPIERARALLEVDPVTFKRRDAWLRQHDERVIPEHDEIDRRTGEKRRKPRRVIPGRTDPRRQMGLIAEDVAAAGFDELVTRDADGKPDGITYDKLAVPLLALVRDLDQRLREIEEGQADE